MCCVSASAVLVAAEDAAAAVEAGRAALAELVRIRSAVVDRLNRRLAADASRGALLDLDLRATHMFRHRPLEFELYVRGDTVYGGHGHLTSWNHGLHEIDADDLRFEDGELRGTMRVTLNPDQWVPGDRRPRHQVHEIAATVTEGEVRGVYRFTGTHGPDKDVLAGAATPVQGRIEIAGPTGREAVAPDVTGLAQLVARATAAYRQLRAAALALRCYPMSYERALSENRVSPPFWQTDGPQAVAEMSDYLARLAAQARGYRVDGSDPDDFAVGFVHPDDPRFGPFFANSALPVAEGMAVLPAETGSDGPQRWQYIRDWEVTGPFPAPYRNDYIEPRLPEWIPAGAACYRLRTADFPDDRFIHPDWLSGADRRNAYNAYQANNWFETFERPAEAVTYAVERSVKTGRWRDSVCPPRWASIQTKVPVWGARKVIYFGAARLRAPRDMRVWCEAAQEDAGQLWINGRLVWHSVKDLKDLKIPKFAIFPVDLRKGENRIVFRVRNDDTQTMYRLLFCTRGAPQERQAAGDAVPEATHCNVRGNGTGSYPAPPDGVRPPLAWDIEEGTNVRWRVPLPSFSNAYPVIVGDRVFTNCEPHTLYCFDKKSGEELWRRESSLAEFVDGPDERAAMALALLELGLRFEGAAIDPEVEKLKTERMAVERKLQAGGDELSEEEEEGLTERSRALGAKIEALADKGRRDRRILGRYGAKAGGWWDWCGFTMPTPVTDGERLWVKYNTGVAACYDMEGERLWMTRTDLTGFIAGVSSPVIVGDRLILEGGWRRWAERDGLSREEINRRTGALERQDLHCILCLDAGTGEILWHNYVKCGIGGYGSPGGPRTMRLTLPDGGHLDVVITQRNVFRVEDGQELHRSTGISPGYAGFVIGNRVYDGPSQAMFWAESRDQIGVRHLVGAGIGGSGYGVAMSGAFFVANPDPNLSAGRTHVPWQDLYIGRQRNGERVYRIHPLMGKTGSPYVPPATCGEYAYLVDGKPGARDNLKAKAVVTVVKVGDPPLVMARSRLDGPTYTSPVFDEGRAYIRTRRSLICLEDTPEGAELTWNKAVEELFAVQSRLPIIPPIEEIATVPPPADYTPTPEVPVNKVYERVGPAGWLVAGPVPPTTRDDPLADLGGAANARPRPGTETDGLTFTALSDEFVDVSQGMAEDLYSREHYRSSVRIDLSGLSRRKGGTYYFFTVLEVTRPRTLQYRNRQPKLSTWLAGREIAADAKYNVSPGFYPLLIRIQVPVLPPFMKDRKLLMTPQFIDVPSTAERLDELRVRVAPYRKRLEKIVETVRGRWSLEARRYLRVLDSDQPGSDAGEVETEASQPAPGR